MKLRSLLAWLLVLVSCAHAAVITVTTTADLLADDGVCSLREAVSAANADTPSGGSPGECVAGSGADQIVLPAGVYTLALAVAGEDANAAGDLDLTSPITLSGAGRDTTIVEGAPSLAAAVDRVLHLLDGATAVTIEHLTIRHGSRPANPGGGGVYADAGTSTVAVTDVLFTENDASHGGAMRATQFGTVVVTDSVFLDNGVDTTGGIGGAVHNAATLTVAGSRFEGNRASTGGALYTVGATTLVGTTFRDNESSAVRASTLVHVADCLFEANVASQGGTLSGGGAIAISGGELNVANTTFSGNASTLASGPGGAIRSQGSGGDVRLTHVTVHGNTVASPSVASAIDVEGFLELAGTVVTAGATPLCGGDPTVTGAANLIDDDSCGADPAFRIGAPTGVDAALADNGGPTETHALLDGSNAVDAVPDCTIAAASSAPFPWDAGRPVFKDQRGFVRGDGANRGGSACDAGAFETASDETNARPVAHAGADRSAAGGVAVVLDGTQSYDVDGTVASFAWTQTGGDPGSLGDAASPTPEFTTPATVGPAALTLVVTDDGGLASRADEVVVTTTSPLTTTSTSSSTSTSLAPTSTTSTSTSTSSSSSSSTVTTSSSTLAPATTTSTTLPLCDPEATLDGITCRIELVRSVVDGAQADLGAFGPVLAKKLLKASMAMDLAGARCALGKLKPARGGLKKAGKQVKKTLAKVRSPKGRQTIPVPLATELGDALEPLGAEIATLRETLACAS
jgi:CSLREA domain-containing protein